MDQDTPGLKPISQFLQPLAESSNNSTLSTSLLAKTDPIAAVERAKLLAGCYRKDDAADPETYAGAVAAVLSEYPPDIVQRVTDPRSGLPSRLNWLPTVKEVRDACEELDARQRRFTEAATREREQLAARKREILSRSVRPTIEEMQAKYGSSWGIPESSVEIEARRAERARALLTEANRRAFVAECKSAGISPDSPISPSLASVLQQKRVNT